MSLLVVIPFCNADAELAKRMVNWMVELEPQRSNQSCLVAYDASVPVDAANEITVEVRKVFRHVIPLGVKVEAKDWPKASNLMFHNVSQFIKDTYRFPFFWMEPDCTPLRQGWMNELAEEYASCPTPFMGPLIKTEEEGLPSVHLTGCSIYPPYAIDILKPFCNDTAALAWDVGSAGEIAKKMKARDTNLIYHRWGMRDLPPTFVYKKEPDKEYPLNTLELSHIPEPACVMHRCKDGTLINALKEQRKSLTCKEPTIKGQLVKK